MSLGSLLIAIPVVIVVQAVGNESRKRLNLIRTVFYVLLVGIACSCALQCELR